MNAEGELGAFTRVNKLETQAWNAYAGVPPFCTSAPKFTIAL